MGKLSPTLYAKEGAKVIAADINLETVNAVIADMQRRLDCHSNNSECYQRKRCPNMIDMAMSTYGTLDILVNNAGIMDNFVPAADVTDETLGKSICGQRNRPYACNKKGSSHIC